MHHSSAVSPISREFREVESFRNAHTAETLGVWKAGAVPRNQLLTGGRAEPHHILPDSGWVSIYLRQASDVDRAIELLRLSFEIANQRIAK